MPKIKLRDIEGVILSVIKKLKPPFEASKKKKHLWNRIILDDDDKLVSRLTCDFTSKRSVKLYQHDKHGRIYYDTPEIRELSKRLEDKGVPVEKRRKEESFSKQAVEEGEQILLEGRFLKEHARWGYNEYLELGQEMFPEFAKSVLLSKAGYMYDKVREKRVRAIQHIMMAWQEDWFKSSLVDSFFGLGAERGKGLLSWQWRVSDPTKVSIERFRGDFTITEKGYLKVLYPYPTVSDVVIVDELTTFLGTGDARKEAVSILNSIVEKGEFSVSFIKGGKVTSEKFRAWQETCSESWLKDSFRFVPYQDRIVCKSRSVLFLLTNYAEQKDFASLKRSGFSSRFKWLTLNLTLKEKADFLTRLSSKLKIETASLEAMRYAWSIVNKTIFKNAEPPAEYIKILLKDFFDELKSQTGADEKLQTKIIGARLRGDLMRELTAHAMDKQWQKAGKIITEFEQIVYRPSDLKYVRGLIPDMVKHAIEKQKLTSGDEVIPKENKRYTILAAIPLNNWVSMEKFYTRVIKATNLGERAIQKQIERLEEVSKIKRRRIGRNWEIMRTEMLEFEKSKFRL